MWYNLKIAFRNLKRNGLYSWINVIGLAVSLTACLLILLWVQDELRFERFYKNADNIYVAVSHDVNEGVENYFPRTPAPLMHAAKEEIAEVKTTCSVNLYWDLGFLEYNGEKFFGNRYTCADTTFFRIFDTEFLEGSLEQAFPTSNAVVVTKSLAKKMFGNEPAVGKTIVGSNGGEYSDDYYVSGVVADQPQNTFIQYDIVFSIEQSRHKNNWQFSGFFGFLQLYPDADLTVVGEKLRQIERRGLGISSVKDDALPYVLFPITKTHLYNWDGNPSGIKSVRMFTLIAAILLVIACINYVNLITARSDKRKKEIGLRKLVGARKKQLFIQLIGEGTLLFFVALALATLLIYLLIPFFNQLTFKELIFSVFDSSTLLLYTAVFLVIIILAGIYPALLLLRFSPMDSISNVSAIDERKKHFTLRKVLVVLQFSCSVILIIATIVLNRQFHLIQTKDVGYSKKQTFITDISLNLNLRSSYESFKNDLLQESSIKGVTASESSLISTNNITGSNNLSYAGMNENQFFSLYYMGIDRDLFSLLELTLLEGEGFDGSSTDFSKFFLNEAAVRAYGMENPVGKDVAFWGGRGTIAGVVKDFHFQHMSEQIAPMLMMLPFYERMMYGNSDIGVISAFRYVYVQPVAGKIPEAIAAAEKIWKKYDTDFPFNYTFMDDSFQRLYSADLQRSKIFNCFSVIAIFVSCLGLFGLVTYTAETKTKEIGIRKILGASVGSIIATLIKDFLILIGIAFFVALPVAYYWLNTMLQDYAYRIDISWWIFVLAALITLLLTLLTVSFQAIKTATANPVNSIKN